MEPAAATPPLICNHPWAQPLAASHHVLMILPSLAVVNRSRWFGLRTLEVTGDPFEATPPLIWNQPLHPPFASHQTLMMRHPG